MSQDHKNLKLVEPGLLEFGQVLQNRYVIQRPLGEGSRGQVYLALDRDNGDQPVALKVLHIDFFRKLTLKALMHEVELSKQVDHQNVVKTLGMGADADLVFYVMDFIPGWALKDLILRETFTAERICEIALDISSGLEAIHIAGLSHRDLKPSNIIITADGRAKITDYTVGKLDDSDKTTHSGMLSSVGYMAPAIWKGEKPSPSDDLYSLGVLIYQLITKKLPFSSSTAAGWMRHHLESKPVPPIEVNPGCPKWLNRLVLNLLSKDSTNRPKSARDVITRIKTHTMRGPEVTSGSQPGKAKANKATFGWGGLIGAATASAALVFGAFSLGAFDKFQAGFTPIEFEKGPAWANGGTAVDSEAGVVSSESDVASDGAMAELKSESVKKDEEIESLRAQLAELKSSSEVSPVDSLESSSVESPIEIGAGVGNYGERLDILKKIINDREGSVIARESLSELGDAELQAVVELLDKRIESSDERAAKKQESYSSLLGE